MRASLFITCYNDTLFPETGRAVVTLLERLGVELSFHAEQTCCGPPASYTPIHILLPGRSFFSRFFAPSIRAAEFSSAGLTAAGTRNAQPNTLRCNKFR